MTAVEPTTGQLEPLGPATWMTCERDKCEHAVLESDFVAGVGHGLYRAVCGHRVTPRALASSCGPRCATCVGNLCPRSAFLAGPPRASRPLRRRFRDWARAALRAR